MRRAESIRATFQGTDISTQTIGTFSKFVPISQDSSTRPSYSLAKGTNPLFYLESMPSKDKSDCLSYGKHVCKSWTETKSL